MIKLGIAGGRGYVGQELLGLLAGIPEYHVQFVGSSTRAGQRVDEHLEFESDLIFQDLTESAMQAADVDAWVIAQPNGRAATLVDFLKGGSPKMVDVSSDYRFDNKWCYGLIEANLEQIKTAERIANPGCYATAAQLALLPIKEMLVAWPVVFGVSGYSGAGKKPNPRNDLKRLRDNLLPYALTGHTHELEISRHLETQVRFAAHVAPFFRGISVTVNVLLDAELDLKQIFERYDNYYRDFDLVTVQADIPEIRDVANTNQSLVGGFGVDERDRRRLSLVCVIDNLRKGAASQIVQNLNCMFGMNAEHGLC